MASSISPIYPTNIIAYFLSALRDENPKLSEEMEQAIHETFTSESGAKVLELLEKAVMLSPCPPGCESRALRERNAQALLVGEIRRMVLHGRRP